MSNANAPFGFRPYRHLAGGTPGRMNEYPIPDAFAENIMFGDLVNLDGSGQVKQAAAAEVILGVFAGVRYVDVSGNVVFKNWWANATDLPTGTLAYGLVYDDPFQTFISQMTTACNAADIGLLADLDAGTDGTATGMSGMSVGAHAGTEDQLKIMRVLEIPVRDASGNQALSAVGNYALVEVKIARHIYAGATAAVEV